MRSPAPTWSGASRSAPTCRATPSRASRRTALASTPRTARTDGAPRVPPRAVPGRNGARALRHLQGPPAWHLRGMLEVPGRDVAGHVDATCLAAIRRAVPVGLLPRTVAWRDVLHDACNEAESSGQSRTSAEQESAQAPGPDVPDQAAVRAVIEHSSSPLPLPCGCLTQDRWRRNARGYWVADTYFLLTPGCPVHDGATRLHSESAGPPARHRPSGA